MANGIRRAGARPHPSEQGRLMSTPLHALILSLALIASLDARSASGLLWFDAGRPTDQASQAVALLTQADAEGLDPQDYSAAALGQALQDARRGSVLNEAAQERLDAALSAALLHFLGDRQNGRIDPRQIRVAIDPPPTRAPPTLETLALALAAHRLVDTVTQTAPQLPMYDSLRRALARYRSLSGHPAWRTALPALPGRKREEGQPYAGVAQLAARLQALGDLAADAPLPETLTGPLLEALRRFQQRHGLQADGVLGMATLQQLEVRPDQRARQIELGMERLRWTPYMQGDRMVVVNVPEFVLRAYQVRDRRIDVQLSMKVIVGKALDTRTPLISELMRFIEFSPYWNVPPSITHKELVPRLRREPAYFQQQGFEFVGPGGDVVTTLSNALLDASASGHWRIRQRPGPLNALGDIKFIFPNNEHIYLHHTPAPQLFQRDRRDFSHGCIRVEEPVALARFVLQDQPGWDDARIEAAMSQGVSSTLTLRSPLPVLIAYNTVIVKTGQVYFYPDLYGHDQLLDRALRQHSAQLTSRGPLTSQAK